MNDCNSVGSTLKGENNFTAFPYDAFGTSKSKELGQVVETA